MNKAIFPFIFLSLLINTLFAQSKPDAGTIENGRYTNEFFGISLEIPEESTAFTKAQMDSMLNVRINEIAKSESKRKKMRADAEKELTNLLMITWSDTLARGARFVMISEELSNSSETKTGGDYLVATAADIKKLNHQVKFIIKDPVKQKIMSREVYMIKTESVNGDNVLTERYYAMIVKGYVVGFVVSYYTPLQEEKINELLFNLKFE